MMITTLSYTFDDAAPIKVQVEKTLEDDDQDDDFCITIQTARPAHIGVDIHLTYENLRTLADALVATIQEYDTAAQQPVAVDDIAPWDGR